MYVGEIVNMRSAPLACNTFDYTTVGRTCSASLRGSTERGIAPVYETRTASASLQSDYKPHLRKKFCRKRI